MNIDELTLRYVLAHVRLNTNNPLAGLTVEEIMDIYAMLPPPIKTFEEWLAAKGISQEEIEGAHNDMVLNRLGANVEKKEEECQSSQ